MAGKSELLASLEAQLGGIVAQHESELVDLASSQEAELTEEKNKCEQQVSDLREQLKKERGQVTLRVAPPGRLRGRVGARLFIFGFVEPRPRPSPKRCVVREETKHGAGWVAWVGSFRTGQLRMRDCGVSHKTVMAPGIGFFGRAQRWTAQESEKERCTRKL